MIHKILLTVGFCTLFLFQAFHISSATADDYTDTKALVDKSTVLLKSFGQDPDMTWYQNNVQYAKAVFIVSPDVKSWIFSRWFRRIRSTPVA